MKAKIANAPRRVWRMTAENQLGEILELPPVHGAGSPCSPQAVTLDLAPVPSWRASSYDLLRGLRVHDVTDKIPTRMFKALFSPEMSGRSPSTKERS